MLAARRNLPALVTTVVVAGCAGTAPLQATRVHTTQLHVEDGLVVVAHAPRELGVSTAHLESWIGNAARAVETYFGRFPVRRVRVEVQPDDGRGAQTGAAYGFGAPLIRMKVGRGSDDEDLANDWMMTHEMVHLAFPRVAAEHHWIEEGLATYIEPIARAQAGLLPVEQVWRDLIEGLPRGLPLPGDRGLDFTPTWGRTYWGGALFCLLADIEIRKRTGNRFGLQHALRGILESGGNIERIWPIERVLEQGDAAVGVPVLSELYARMRATPVEVDLEGLWRELGVSVLDGEVVFDEQAPLAAIRRAITQPPPAA
jgi:hypothetical protein